MSEFASMLDSFKKSAAETASSKRRTPSPRNKRPLPPANEDAERRYPHPSLPPPPPPPPAHYYDVRKNTSNNFRRGGVSSSSSKDYSSSSSSSSSSFELSFLVIGAQKAGTSWLHAQLRKCDNLSLPRYRKEVHYWDWHRRKGYDWYVRQFDFPPQPPPRGDDDDRHRHRHRRSLLLYGEITPCYVVLPPSTIAEIGRMFPRLKLVFVARNLVDRAWSAMVMELRDLASGMNPGEFADGVVVEEEVGGAKKRSRGEGEGGGASFAAKNAMSGSQRLRVERQSSPSSQPDKYFLERLISETHASRSDYATHLKHWYEHFPSENILIVDYRMIESDPRGVLRDVAAHLGLDGRDADAYVASLREMDVRRRVNSAAPDAVANANDACAIMPEDGDVPGAGDPPLPSSAAAARGGGADDDGAAASRRALSRRPDLERRMREYLLPYSKEFNKLLQERGYSWRLIET